ncbi:MAG: cytochrome c family protein [Proteobacteria bacterium]|nr:cytochrome c family protein [Pseudomonadota bacterium]
MKTDLYPCIRILLLICLFLVSGTPHVSGNPLKIDQFISPETCGDCHGDIYHQWKQSMHNLSHHDPVYLGLSTFILTGLQDKNEIDEAESCVKCHTPVGNITGYPEKSSDDRKKIPEIATYGIQCDYCHSATGAKKPYNNGLVLSPGNGENDPGIKRGPFKNSESSFHDTAFSEFHTRSEICGTCHNVKHVAFNTDLETTYDEWKNGPYYSEDEGKIVLCQDCHMYQRPGIPATGSTKRPMNPGTAADDGPSREHIFTHYFVGANAFVPGQFGNAEKNKMAEERLKHAATLSIVSQDIHQGHFDIIILNNGAGHKLPTGLTDVRQMWLEVTVLDEKGSTLLSSGEPDKSGYLKDGTLIYNTIFGDGRGNPVPNISKAREILKDNRIPPRQSAKETYAITQKNWESLKIKARLLYRSAPQKILDTVLGDKTVKLPIIVMAETEKEIKRQKEKSDI